VLTDHRLAIILVDYPAQARLKILGRVDVLEGEAAEPWLARVQPESRSGPRTSAVTATDGQS
jgi:hypothetical protein